MGISVEVLEEIRSRAPRERVLRAAKVALTIDEEPNSDLIEYVAGYAPRSAVYHYFRSMAELLQCAGAPKARRRLSTIILPPRYFDLASVVPQNAEKFEVHMEDAGNSNQFSVWQKLNGGMRSVMLNRCVRRTMFLAGIVLYAGEGTKSLKTGRVEVANSNPGLLRLYVGFMNELGFPKNGLRARVQIHTATDNLEAENVWSKELGLSPTQFMKPLMSSPGNPGARRTFTLQLSYPNTMLLILLRHWTENADMLVQKLDLE